MRGPGSGEVRQIVRAAMAEAQRRGDRHVGTEHMLLGVLSDPVGLGPRTLGIDLELMRTALLRLDRDALASVGVDPDLAVPTRSRTGHRPRRMGLSSGAKQLLHTAVVDARALGDREITTRHVLLALLGTEPPDHAAVLLQALVVDVAAARAALLPIPTDGH